MSATHGAPPPELSYLLHDDSDWSPQLTYCVNLEESEIGISASWRDPEVSRGLIDIIKGPPPDAPSICSLLFSYVDQPNQSFLPLDCFRTLLLAF